MTEARRKDLGITEAIWMHSGGGKHPRASHVAAGREKVRYKIGEGWYDPEVKRFVLPGELPNCSCVSRAVIPGL
jgi:hypothetical protein